MPMEKKRWIILVIQIIIGIAGFFIYLLANFVGPLNELKGWSITSMLFVFTAMTWISPFAMMVGGKLRDRFGNRNVIVVLGLVYGVSICVSVLFKNVVGFVIFGGFITAFAMFGVFVCQLSNVGLLFPDRRGFAIGLYNGVTGFGLAAITMPVVFLVEKIGIVPAIITLGVVMGGLTAGLGVFAIDPPYGYEPKGWKEKKEKKIEAAGKDSPRLQTTGLEYDWRKMIKTSTFYVLLIALMGIQIGGMSISANVSMMAQTALGVDGVGGGLYATLGSTAAGVGALIIGGIIDKLGISKAFILLGGIDVIGTVLYLVAGQGMPLFFGLVVVTAMMGQSGQAVLMASAAMNYFGDKNSGFNIGVLGISALGAGLIVPVLAGSGNVNRIFLVICLASLMSVIAAFILRKTVVSMVKKENATATVNVE